MGLPPGKKDGPSLAAVADELLKKLVTAIQENDPEAEAAAERRAAESDARIREIIEESRKMGKLPPKMP